MLQGGPAIADFVDAPLFFAELYRHRLPFAFEHQAQFIIALGLQIQASLLYAAPLSISSPDRDALGLSTGENVLLSCT